MEGFRDLLERIRHEKLAEGEFRGLLHILIGRKITLPEGTVISNGNTWRETANILKNIRWDKDAVKELGLDPETLAPRDRSRFWYSAIIAAQPDGPEARASAERLIPKLVALGIVIGPAPGQKSS